MREAFQDVKIRKNFLIFLFYWFTQVLTYIGLPIELESVGGNLYVNLAIFALLELVSSFIASELSLKYDFLYVFKHFINFTIVLFLLFFLVPSYLKTEETYVITFFVIDCFCVKLTYDTTWHLIGMYLPNLFTNRFYGQYLIVAVCISRFSLIFLPYINYLTRSIGLHPFALYSILWLISRLLLGKAEVIYQKKGQTSCEMISGVAIQSQKIYEEDSANKIVIRRENKLQKYVELKEGLMLESGVSIPVTHDSPSSPLGQGVINNIDTVMGSERRTLIFEDLNQNDLPKLSVILEPPPKLIEIHSKLNEKSRKIENSPKREEINENGENGEKIDVFNENLPIIIRKNIGSLKRRMSNLDVSAIIKNENPISDEKNTIYRSGSPLHKDIISEEQEK